MSSLELAEDEGFAREGYEIKVMKSKTRLQQELEMAEEQPITISQVHTIITSYSKIK